MQALARASQKGKEPLKKKRVEERQSPSANPCCWLPACLLRMCVPGSTSVNHSNRRETNQFIDKLVRLIPHSTVTIPPTRPSSLLLVPYPTLADFCSSCSCPPSTRQHPSIQKVLRNPPSHFPFSSPLKGKTKKGQEKNNINNIPLHYSSAHRLSSATTYSYCDSLADGSFVD
jgi:hypothetical protein